MIIDSLSLSFITNTVFHYPEKFETIMTIMSEGKYSNIINVPGTQLFISDFAQLMLTPNQFSLSSVKPFEYEGESIDELLICALKAMDFLLQDVPDPVVASCRFSTVRDVCGEQNAFNKTLALAPSSLLGIENAMGVGYRVFVENVKDGTLDEFKFEPLVMDKNKYYFEGLKNFKHISIGENANTLKNAYIRFRDDIDMIYSKI